ncbi:MAG TPA: hypothetical protein VNH40_05565 [Gaiellaceae bacterium]|nr:hypothetical protein [Gaiellaceae bacterium]
MSTCTLDLEHYRSLLEDARAAGYDWASFDRHPRPGDLFLRHDVRVSLEAALELARLEHELGARATYLLMTESAFYNLDSHVGHYAQRQLRQWGHAVGLHAVHPRAELDRRFDKVVSWHNPERSYETEPVFGAVNVAEEPYGEHLLSDEGGCPHEAVAAGGHEWLQLSLHAERWVYPNGAALLEAKREQWRDYLAADGLELG